MTALALRAAASSVFERWVILEAHCLLHFTSKTEDSDRLEALGFYALVKRRPSPSAAPPALRLGTNAKLPSRAGREALAGGGPSQGAGPDARIIRYALQAGAKELLGPVILEGEQIWSGVRRDGRQHRTCHCCRRPIDAEAGVGVFHAPEHKSARFGNVQTCGSVWACPVCAAVVSELRRRELSAALVAARARGWRVVMLTRTVSHFASDTMAQVLGLVKDAMNRATSGRAALALREKYNVVGSVRSLEVTWGRNGYHPHIHELLILESDYDLNTLRAEFGALWGRAVTLAGGRDLHEKHGFDAVDCNVRIADYVAKWGRDPAWNESHELAKAVSKRGRGRGQFTPLELLAAFTFEGNVYAGQRWLEYALAMRGKHQLQWSRGLKRLLGVADVSDDEAAAAPLADGVLLATIPLPAWRKICRIEERGRVLAAAAAGDVLAFHRLLDELVPELEAELETLEHGAHGWPVAPKNLRDTSDKSICWQVDRRIDAQRDAVGLGLTVEQGEEYRARARKIRLVSGGEVGDYQAWLDRVAMLN